MIVDGHAHVGLSEYGNETILMEQMKKAKVDKAVIVPGGIIDVRKMSNYIDGTSKPEVSDIEPIMKHLEKVIKKYHDMFYAFINVNPHVGKYAVEYVENSIKERGFSGLKLAPVCHKFSFDNSIVKQLAHLCGELNVPFYTHSLDVPGTTTSDFEKLVKDFPKTTFILGHMGCGPNDVKAMEIVAKYDNMYLETSLGNYLGIKNVLKTAGASKLIFGSEFPLSHPSVELMKIELQDISVGDKEKILSKNILDILSLR